MAPRGQISQPRRNTPSRDTQDLRQTSLTTQSSNPGLTSRQETSNQQRSSGNPNSIVDTTTRMHGRATKTFDPGSQPPSADRISTYKSEKQYRDLLGVVSQAFNEEHIQYESRTAHIAGTSMRAYHRSILQEGLMKSRPGQGLGPMDRYLAEGPAEQYAVLCRPGSSIMSTYNGYRCLERMDGSIDTNEWAQE
ncbi:hypothetical protein N7G274_004483 [Stereocaulon virgatum]|uniref:Uncharacterized protein n=1 Tax=Stereocaulon virgatum TaxID=373712 RepID=A0ABR4ADC6_9LECA